MPKTYLLVSALTLIAAACAQPDSELVPRQGGFAFGTSLAVNGDHALASANGSLHFFEREDEEWKSSTIMWLAEDAGASPPPYVALCGPDRAVFSHSNISGLVVRQDGGWVLERELSPPARPILCSEDIVIYGNRSFARITGVWYEGASPGSVVGMSSDGRMVAQVGGGLTVYALQHTQWVAQGVITAGTYPRSVVLDGSTAIVVNDDGTLEPFEEGASGWETQGTIRPREMWGAPMVLAKGRLVGVTRVTGTAPQEYIRVWDRDDESAGYRGDAFLATDNETPDFGAIAFDGDTLLVASVNKVGGAEVHSYDMR